MGQQLDNDLSPEVMQALRLMVIENLLLPVKGWWPWIKRMTTKEFKRMLVTLILYTNAQTQEMNDRLLDLLGTTAGEMTKEELATWGEAILLARNRMLAAREVIVEAGKAVGLTQEQVEVELLGGPAERRGQVAPSTQDKK